MLIHSNLFREHRNNVCGCNCISHGLFNTQSTGTHLFAGVRHGGHPHLQGAHDWRLFYWGAITHRDHRARAHARTRALPVFIVCTNWKSFCSDLHNTRRVFALHIPIVWFRQINNIHILHTRTDIGMRCERWRMRRVERQTSLRHRQPNVSDTVPPDTRPVQRPHSQPQASRLVQRLVGCDLCAGWFLRHGCTCVRYIVIIGAGGVCSTIVRSTATPRSDWSPEVW